MSEKTEEKKKTTREINAALKGLSRVTDFAPPDAERLDPLLRRPQVETVTGLSTSALYRLVKLRDFPQPIQVTPGTVGWRYSEVSQWLNNRPRAAV